MPPKHQELPGLYYDAEKNRYFPIKGPIPGSSSSSHRKRKPPSPNPPPPPIILNNNNNITTRRRRRSEQLLQVREICGGSSNSRGLLNFEAQYQNNLASQPHIWKYDATEKMVDHAIQQLNIHVNTDHGLVNADILLTAGLNSTLCLFEVGRATQDFGRWVNCTPDQVWPSHSHIKPQPQGNSLPKHLHLQRNRMATLGMPSHITCIKIMPNPAAHPSSTHLLITTLGSEASRGSLYHLHFREPVDYSTAPLAWRNVDEITSFNRTIWTAGCNSDGTRALLGTNAGAVMVDIETGARSSVCRCESDILSLQVDHSGNFVLCGLRNGAILTLDARQRPEDFSARLARHKIPYPSSKPLSKRTGNATKRWFEIQGHLHADRTIFMPSSISSLASLQLYDQYFCASSMDGSIKLYDHRLIQRGAVQSYEGNVNSHTRIHLGVDPEERYLMSGGEDCNLRFWSIKTGELLFENKFMNSVPSVVCWPKTEDLQSNKGQGYGRSWGAWVGSVDGLFYVNWPWNCV